MNADGKWALTVKSPLGIKTDELELKTVGGVLTGTQISAELGTHPDLAIKVDGDELSWSVPVTKPMKLTLQFTLKMTGDSMTGTVKAAMLGTAPVTGKRVLGA